MSIKTKFMALPKHEQNFLQNLVGFGGACTQNDVAKGLEIDSRRTLQRRIASFVKDGFLESRQFHGLRRNPKIYFPSRALGGFLGCDRRLKSEPKFAVEKCFRFAVALENADRNLTGVMHKTLSPDLSEEACQLALAHKRDEVLTEQTVLIDVQPYWSLEKIKTRVGFWVNVNPNLSIEIWAPTENLLHWLTQKLPVEMLERITKMVCIRHMLSNDFCTTVKDELVCEIK